MPQMYPLNWLILFFMYLTIFFLILILNYFIFLPKMKLKKKEQTFLKQNFWKW